MTNAHTLQAGRDAAAHQGLLKDKSIQFGFPDAGPMPRPPGWLERLAKWLADHFAFLPDHWNWFRYAEWTILGCVVLFVGYRLLRYLIRRRLARDDSTGPHLPVWQPSVEQARLLLKDADSLAEQGRFGEAAHLLLLVSIQEIRNRRPGLVAPALTSREIARLEALSPQARAVFGEIARVVEGGLFGERPLRAQDFSQCRNAFAQFTVPEAWTIAA